MKIVPFERSHLEGFALQDAQTVMSAYLNPEYGGLLEAAGPAFSGLVEGRPLAFAGLAYCHSHRAVAWAILSPMGPRHFHQVHRHVRRFLDAQRIRRIEALVDVDFAAGHRWMRTLGFQMEAPRLRAYAPDGQDHALYARIRKDEA